MPDREEAVLSPAQTTVPFRSIDGLSPEHYEQLFGPLHGWKERFYARWFFGEQKRSAGITRRYALAAWNRLSGPIRLVIRDLRTIKEKATGLEKVKLYDSVARLSLDDLRVLLGPRLYDELLRDHKDSILGVAMQLMEADRRDYETWIESRGTARPKPKAIGELGLPEAESYATTLPEESTSS